MTYASRGGILSINDTGGQHGRGENRKAYLSLEKMISFTPQNHTNCDIPGVVNESAPRIRLRTMMLSNGRTAFSNGILKCTSSALSPGRPYFIKGCQDLFS